MDSESDEIDSEPDSWNHGTSTTMDGVIGRTLNDHSVTSVAKEVEFANAVGEAG